MNIEVLYFKGCPTYKTAESNARRALNELSKSGEITLVEITQETAEENKFLGSPTVRVNGVDVDPLAKGATDYGIKCRIYHTFEGLKGWPDVQMIKKAIKKAT